MRTILGSMLICIFSFLPIQDGLLGQDLAIEHVQVVDVVDGKILSDQTVIVSAGKIREVGPTAKIVVPAEATRIDGQQRYDPRTLGHAHPLVRPRIDEVVSD